MSINMILACGLNGELGQTSSPDGLPWSRNPEDMKMFRELTTGNVVVYGGNTFRQFQKMGMKRGLPKRKNIVLSSSGRNSLGLNRGLVNVVSDIDWLISEGFEYLTTFGGMDINVVGGKTIYDQLHPYCDKIYLTRINQEFKEADVKINLDFLCDFDIISTEILNDYSHVEVWERKN